MTDQHLSEKLRTAITLAAETMDNGGEASNVTRIAQEIYAILLRILPGLARE